MNFLFHSLQFIPFAVLIIVIWVLPFVKPYISKKVLSLTILVLFIMWSFQGVQTYGPKLEVSTMNAPAAQRMKVEESEAIFKNEKDLSTKFSDKVKEEKVK